MAKRKKLVWFARGSGVASMGPYKTQIEAVNALRLVQANAAERRLGIRKTGLFPPNAFVWPEEEVLGKKP